MSFEPRELGKTIFEQRYARYEGETWEAACKRVAEHVATAEEPERIREVTDAFHEELVNGRFMPGGRIWYGAGRPKPQLLNCFVLPTSDSREGWGKTLNDTLVVSGLGGGVGINASSIRPRNSVINGTGGHATGAVSFMDLVDGIGHVLRGGGGRRMALMLSLEVDHPDLPEFLDAKLNRERLTNANVSVIINEDPNEFVAKVRSNAPLIPKFGGVSFPSVITYGELWDRIVRNAWESGEPGILNGHFANSASTISYHTPLISTNPCGEIWLEKYGCCDLGALVLPRFVTHGQVGWGQLAETVRTSVRFLDDVLTINHYPLNEIAENSTATRRIGLGVMGLHTMLMQLGLVYDSDKARSVVGEIFRFIRNTAYKASIDLAKEKGPFHVYDERMLDSGFAMGLPDDIRAGIRAHGTRNCALLTIAPTGTTGMVQGVSTGIEPLFAPAYYRRWWEGDLRRKELVISQEYLKYGELAQGAYDISPEGHFAMQAAIQPYIDNAVSKTINIPADYDVTTLSDVWLRYLPSLKGTTLYRAGSRGEEPLEAVPVSSPEIARYLTPVIEGMSIEQYGFDCPGGSCEINYEEN